MTLKKLPVCLGLGLTLIACTPSGGEKASLPEQPIVNAAAPAKAETTAKSQSLENTAQAAPAAAAQESTPGEMKAPVLDEAQAKKDNAPVSSRFSGEVSSQRKAGLAFRVQGFVQEIRLRPGNSCKKGDVLASLDPRDFKLNADVARSQRDLARVALDTSKNEYDRELELKKDNASTAALFDKIKAAYDKARIDFELTELNLKRAEQALADTKLLAPYDCVVTKQMKNIGENVQFRQCRVRDL